MPFNTLKHTSGYIYCHPSHCTVFWLSDWYHRVSLNRFNHIQENYDQMVLRRKPYIQLHFCRKMFSSQMHLVPICRVWRLCLLSIWNSSFHCKLDKSSFTQCWMRTTSLTLSLWEAPVGTETLWSAPSMSEKSSRWVNHLFPAGETFSFSGF